VIGVSFGTLPKGATSGIRTSQVRLGILCRFQEHHGLFGEDRVSISERHWSVCEFMCWSQNSIGLFGGIGFGGVDHLETLLGFYLT